MPSPFLYPPPAISQPVIIREDGGGLVSDYIKQAQTYASQGRRVEIRGSCRSACLLALSVPNVCVAPGAVVKAHNAYDEKTGERHAEVTAQMLSYLPAGIRHELDGKIEDHYTDASTLTYQELRRLGVAECKDARRVKSPLDAIARFFGGNK